MQNFQVEVTLSGGQLGLWKPSWYPRSLQSVIAPHSTAYAGKDRHFGEISAFYLNLILGYNTAPIVVGRRVQLAQDIEKLSTSLLKSTFFYNESLNALCFYGICHFCKKDEAICQHPGETEGIEGALVLWMHRKFKTVPNPWRRTYTKGLKAPWERNMEFCNTLMKDLPRLTRGQVIVLR